MGPESQLLVCDPGEHCSVTNMTHRLRARIDTQGLVISVLRAPDSFWGNQKMKVPVAHRPPCEDKGQRLQAAGRFVTLTSLLRPCLSCPAVQIQRLPGNSFSLWLEKNVQFLPCPKVQMA